MILLQLSAGQGPLECARAVGLALKSLDQDCKRSGVRITLLEAEPSARPDAYKSVLLQVDGTDEQQARQFAQAWEGVMLWVCQSPFRPKHKRKNWYFSGVVFDIDEASDSGEMTFQTCRASGAGGQHVNTTDSAVRATHTASGLSVRVESERSQHANKRLARALLLQKLAEKKQADISAQEQARWQQHQALQRGEPVKTFKGAAFVSV